MRRGFLACAGIMFATSIRVLNLGLIKQADSASEHPGPLLWFWPKTTNCNTDIIPILPLVHPRLKRSATGLRFNEELNRRGMNEGPWQYRARR